MGYSNQLAIEIRAPEGMTAEKLQYLRNFINYPNEQVREAVEQEYETADEETKAVVRDFMTLFQISDDNGIAVLRYFCPAYKGGSEIDRAAWVVGEIISSAGCSGSYKRLGEEFDDFEQIYWGDDKETYNAVLWTHLLLPQWLRFGVYLDQHDIRQLLDDFTLPDEQIRTLSEAVFPEIEQLLKRKAAELRLI